MDLFDFSVLREAQVMFKFVIFELKIAVSSYLQFSLLSCLSMATPTVRLLAVVLTLTVK